VELYRSRAPRDVHQPHIAILTVNDNVAKDQRTDDALMHAFRDGDALAFEELYKRWRGPLYRYFLRQCTHAGQAEELFQDIFMRVIGAAATYQGNAKFSAWLFRIAHNRLVDHWRAAGVEPVDPMPINHCDDDDYEFDPPAPVETGPEQQVERLALGKSLVAALTALPELQREAFLLAEEAGLPLDEIAALTGVGRETIKSRLRYATAKLRIELESWR
jgi:RNA polymerase sigma factor (sigma-70 family)